jgi:two-component system, OmpR family, sensor kinase
MAAGAGLPFRLSRPGAPIALQVLGLLVVCLLAAQAISLAVVFTTRPPRPSIYRLREVGEALRGGALHTRQGRPLMRSVAARPPEPEPERQAVDNRLRLELAQTMHVPAEQVRVVEHTPDLMQQLMSGYVRRRPRPVADVLRAEGLGTDAAPRPAAARSDGVMAGLRGPAEPAVFGDFTAAARRPDGAWTIVRPTPEPFPNEWQRRMSLWFLGCLVVITPAGYLFARRITAPIDRFAEAAETLGRDPHAPLMTLSGPAEIGKAARAFNDMQARLKRYVEHRTAMVGAISHDLRTPLARIRFKLEVDPPDRAAILADVEQMEQMVTSVLAFIRDASTPQRRERLDLRSLVECVVDDAALMGGDVEVAEGAPVIAEGDAVALQRLFANLVDNALKYGRLARIRLAPVAGEAVVEIEDRGPGLPAGDLERVFDPFYRAEASRSLELGGVGLGLSIARSTARAHGGDVTLQAGVEGLTAIVRLPLARTGAA